METDSFTDTNPNLYFSCLNFCREMREKRQMWTIYQAEPCGEQQLHVSTWLNTGCSVGSPMPGCRTTASQCPVGRRWKRLKGEGPRQPWLGNHSYQKQTRMTILNLSAVPAAPLQPNRQEHQQKVIPEGTGMQR